VVGDAGSAKQAIRLVQELQPDIITMDLDMPGTNGLQTIDEIMHQRARPILVVSNFAGQFSREAALAVGALDTMEMPEFTPEHGALLLEKIRMLASIPVVTRIRSQTARTLPGKPPAGVVEAEAVRLPVMTGHYSKVFAIACSTGGPQALASLLPALPRDFPCPILIAQHIVSGFAAGMVDWLRTISPLPVELGQEGSTLSPGRIYFSPAEQNLAVAPDRTLTLRPQGPDDTYHPSCDVLLESVAEVFGRQAIGIILTGMGHDGVKGMARIREAQGSTLAQNEATSLIYGMNRAAIEAGAIDEVLPLSEIPEAMLRLSDPFAKLLDACGLKG
jgi:two-component system, chemotaxis family, protein-glutamate methylesterase/glutaminase